MTYIFCLCSWLDLSVYWAATVCVSQRSHLQTIFWVVMAKPREVHRLAKVLLVFHMGFGCWAGILQEVFWVGWPTYGRLSRPCLCPGEPSSVPGRPGQLVIPEARGQRWSGGLDIRMQWRGPDLLLSRGIPLSYLWTFCSENLTACCFVSIYCVPGKAHTPMRWEEIAACSWDYFGAMFRRNSWNEELSKEIINTF